MKKIPIILIALLLAGCTYNGKLKSGFYTPPTSANKIPLKANLICGDSFKTTKIDPGHISGAYAVKLETDPALQEALTTTCKSLFDEVCVSHEIDAKNQYGADLNLFPKLGMEGTILRFTLTVKNTSGDVIKQYESNRNFKFGPPPGVHFLNIINIPFCGMLFPVVIPSNTFMIGRRGERIFNEQVAACLKQVADEIRNDATLLSKNHHKAETGQ